MNTPALAQYGQLMRESLATYQKDLAAALPAVEEWTAKSRDALNAGRPCHCPRHSRSSRSARRRSGHGA